MSDIFGISVELSEVIRNCILNLLKYDDKVKRYIKI